MESLRETGWITLDEREVDYDDEETLNNHLAEMNKELCDKLENSTLLSKVFNFVSNWHS